MPACPSCSTDIPDSAVFCPRCSAPTPWGTDVTHRGIFDGGAPLINAVVVMVIVTTIVLTIQKLGLVATVMLFLTNQMMSSAAVTLDSSKWFFGNSVLIMAIPVALASYAFYASRGGEPLLGRRFLD